MKITPEIKEKIKGFIESRELIASGLGGLNGTDATVTNLRINQRANLITYTVTLRENCDNYSERYDNCEANFTKVMELINKNA